MQLQTEHFAAGRDAYEQKAVHYFDGIRHDFVALLPKNGEQRVLEVGCGHGGTGEAALASGKCKAYCGVELSARAAEVAARILSEVVVGDVEELELPWREESFDALIMSEVLEHLRDPWAVLRRLRRLLKPDALVLASSPNIAHYRIIFSLLKGEWTYTESGPMDRTHLRWFTPASYRRLFEETGYRVKRVQPVGPPGPKSRLVARFLGDRMSWLWMTQICLLGYRE